MRAISFSTIFILIGALSLSASACEHSVQAAVDKPQMATDNGHDSHSAYQATDGTKPKNGFDGMPALGTKAFCPVMNNEFEVKKDSQRSVYKGKTYVFCCPGCKPKFDENPEKYIKK